MPAKSSRKGQADYPAVRSEYKIEWTFIPDLTKMPANFRHGAIERFCKRIEKDGWKVTQESKDLCQKDSEHWYELVSYGLAGWMTRMELKRPFHATNH